MKRIEYLDSMRGLAALSVVSLHAWGSFMIFYQANYNNEYVNGFMRFLVESPFKLLWGGIGVLLFFVLSGFVLTNMFSKYSNTMSYAEYIGKRFLRIYIPYSVAMAVSVMLTVLFIDMKSPELMSPLYDNRWNHMPTIESILSYVFMLDYDMTNVNGVVWTLYHEMRISIIFPIMAFIILKLHYKKSLLISLVFSIGLMEACYLIANLISNDSIRSVVYMAGNTFFYTFFFFIGGYLSKYKEGIVTFVKSKGSVFIWSLFLIAITLIANKWMNNFVNLNATRLQELITGVGILFLFVAIMSSDPVEKVLTVKPLKWLGKISYGIYLTHIPIIMVTTTLLSPVIGMQASMVFALLLVVPVANLFHRTVEVPSIRWSKSLGDKIRERKNMKADLISNKSDKKNEIAN